MTIGSIHGGQRHNIIPAEVTMTGTIRTFRPEMSELAETRLRAILKGVTEAAGATGEVVRYERGAPATINHTTLTRETVPALERVVGKAHVTRIPPAMGSEDFSFFANEVPGFFYRLGPGEAGHDLRRSSHADLSCRRQLDTGGHQGDELRDRGLPLSTQIDAERSCCSSPPSPRRRRRRPPSRCARVSSSCTRTRAGPFEACACSSPMRSRTSSSPGTSLPRGRGAGPDQILQAIRDVEQDGLVPRDYHLAAIESLRAAPADSPDRDADLQILLTDAVASLVNHVRFGKVRPSTLDRRWNVNPRAGAPPLEAFLADVAAAPSPAAAIEALKPSHFIYRGLKQALATQRTAASTGGWPVVPAGRDAEAGREARANQRRAEAPRGDGRARDGVRQRRVRRGARRSRSSDSRSGIG